MKLEIGKRYVFSDGMVALLLCFLEQQTHTLAVFKGRSSRFNSEYTYNTKHDGSPTYLGMVSVVKEYKEPIKVTTYHRLWHNKYTGGITASTRMSQFSTALSDNWTLVKEWEETHEIEVE